MVTCREVECLPGMETALVYLAVLPVHTHARTLVIIDILEELMPPPNSGQLQSYNYCQVSL